MAAPWEKYAAPAPAPAAAPEAAAAGPWAKYGAPAGSDQPVAPPAAGQTPPPAPPEPSFWDQVGEAINPVNLPAHAIGAGENILSGLTAAAGGIHGLYKGGKQLLSNTFSDTTESPVDVAARTIEEDTYQPRTESGKRLGAEIGNLGTTAGRGYGEIAKLVGAPDSVVTGIEDYLPVGLNLGAAIAGGPKAAGVVERATAPSEAAIRPAVPDINNPVQTARAAGFQLRPSDIKAANPSEKVPGLRRERLQNGPQTEKEFVQGNQVKSTELAGEDIGIPGATRIGDKELTEAKAPHFKVYEAANDALKTVPPSPEFAALVQQGADAARLKGGQSTTKVISALRRKAKKNIAADDVTTQEAGYDAKDLADSIEEGLGKQLAKTGDEKLFEDYQASRQALAKIHNVESSLDGSQVNTAVLRRINDKYPGQLTGNLKILAETAEHFPKITKSSLKTSGPSGGETVGHSKTNIVTSLGKAIGRNIPGMNIKSKRFQNKFGREANAEERSTFKDFGKRKPAEE